MHTSPYPENVSSEKKTRENPPHPLSGHIGSVVASFVSLLGSLWRHRRIGAQWFSAVGFVAVLVGTLLLVTNVKRLSTTVQRLQDDQAKSDQQRRQNQVQYDRKLRAMRDEILTALIASKTEDITSDADTDQERCLQIARWIATHITNRRNVSGGATRYFSIRAGLCSARSHLFVTMASLLNIPARIYNIYNFGRVGGGHTCVQAYYDGQWHFFDPTYGGVFVRDGKVLSWEEIQALGGAALQHLQVFQGTRDFSGALGGCPVEQVAPEQLSRVKNTERMSQVYTAETIRNARSHGFYRQPDVKTLYPVVDLASIENGLHIGKIDGQSNDVEQEGRSRQLTERLSVALGNRVDTFHITWVFKNGGPGTEYAIDYYLHNAYKADVTFWAKAEGAEILEGQTFTTDQPLVEGTSRRWRIRFRCNDADGTCRITLGYDDPRQPCLLEPDKIEILSF